MSPEHGSNPRQSLTKEQRAELERQRAAYLKKCLEENARVRQRARQPNLLPTETICADCGNPLSQCTCADQGVSHHPGRVPR